MNAYAETSLPAVFQNRASQNAALACLSFKNSSGKWQDLSWQAVNEQVLNLAAFLLDLGLGAGSMLGLFSANRPEWWIADLAALSIGAVDVPIYATNSSVEARFILNDADCEVCFVGNADQLAKVTAARAGLPKLRVIISFDEPSQPTDGVISFKQALASGAACQLRDEILKRIEQLKAESLATLIYTSGTTGNPKGVMLSHKNLLTNACQVYTVSPEVFESEPLTFLSFLPLSHSFERTVGFYLPLYTSKYQAHKVAFAEDFSHILENFVEVRPSMIVSVPRLYEKIHAGVQAKVSTAPAIKKALFGWSMQVANRNLAFICNNRSPEGLFALAYKLADHLIFSKLRAALGLDRLKYAASGGGALSKNDAEFFLGMGIRILEGYGLSETSPVTNVNTLYLIKPGTVGPAVIETEVKLSAEGEVLIKGPQVMQGYYKNETATKDVFDPEGFFKTGDLGEIDADGYLRITGRIKDIIVTSGGKNISPQNLENSLKASSYIEQVAIIGDNRRFLSALIVPAFAELERWATAHEISFDSRAVLIARPDVQTLFRDEIDKCMSDFARVEQIRKFTLLDREWSQETGELTPTLKLKRRVIYQKYSQTIDGLYDTTPKK